MNKIKRLGFIMSILNAITGCVAGTVLVNITGNYLYFITNIITGATTGVLMAFALQEKSE